MDTMTETRPPNVAPTWPPLATDEDMEGVWVRADLTTEWAFSELTGWGMDAASALLPTGSRACFLNLEDPEMDGGWSLQYAHPDQHDEVVVYRTFAIVESCGAWDADGEHQCSLQQDHDGQGHSWEASGA